ncbi:hypothetical protein Hanom_Chr05g00449351 [Helianthus anomalus]
MDPLKSIVELLKNEHIVIIDPHVHHTTLKTLHMRTLLFYNIYNTLAAVF